MWGYIFLAEKTCICSKLDSWICSERVKTFSPAFDQRKLKSNGEGGRERDCEKFNFFVLRRNSQFKTENRIQTAKNL